jgi:putative Holliday junction resolvase
VKRAAGVDYGRRRIGLAVCDPLGIAVRGLATLERGADLAQGARRVAAVLAAEGVEHVVLGLPLHASGEESEMSAEVRRFAVLLEEALGLPVELVDEGLTTWEAEERVRERGIPLREAKRSGALDREAACCLLRAWLREAHP